MTGFLFGGAVLLLFACLFALLPARSRLRPAAQDDDSNMQWYLLRREELAREAIDASELEQDAALRLLEDQQLAAASADVSQPALSTRFPGWALAPVIVVLAAGIYWQLGGAGDVRMAQQLASIGEQSSEQDIERLMQALQARSGQRPDNLQYKALLGRMHMAREDFPRAASVYAELARQAPEDPQVLAYAAQAAFLANDRQLDPAAQMLAEQALAVDPQQRTALSLLGMASFEREQYAAAISYWERLLDVEPPGSQGATMIQSVIANARIRLGQVDPALAAAPTQAPPMTTSNTQGAGSGADTGLLLRIEVPPGAAINPQDTVYVFARDAASGARMPVAVRRMTGADLPLTLRLDDRHSMAGQKVSALQQAVVEVQVSPGGQPGVANASYIGRAQGLAPGAAAEPVSIMLVAQSN